LEASAARRRLWTWRALVALAFLAFSGLYWASSFASWEYQSGWLAAGCSPTADCWGEGHFRDFAEVARAYAGVIVALMVVWLAVRPLSSAVLWGAGSLLANALLTFGVGILVLPGWAAVGPGALLSVAAAFGGVVALTLARWLEPGDPQWATIELARVVFFMGIGSVLLICFEIAFLIASDSVGIRSDWSIVVLLPLAIATGAIVDWAVGQA
jgi:hypothetical protein